MATHREAKFGGGVTPLLAACLPDRARRSCRDARWHASLTGNKRRNAGNFRIQGNGEERATGSQWVGNASPTLFTSLELWLLYSSELHQPVPLGTLSEALVTGSRADKNRVTLRRC